jgi:hypothetical protein
MAALLQEIIDKIADEADDFLAEASSRAQARAGIEELLTADYPRLAAADRAKVVAGVIAILDKEGFFEGAPGENVWDEEIAGEGS